MLLLPVWNGQPCPLLLTSTFDVALVLRSGHSAARRRRARNPLLHAALQTMWRRAHSPPAERRSCGTNTPADYRISSYAPADIRRLISVLNRAPWPCSW